MGTIGVGATVGLDDMVRQHRPDVLFVDAPVSGTRLPMLEALSRQWRAAVDAGYGRDDVSAARLALGHPAPVAR